MFKSRAVRLITDCMTAIALALFFGSSAKSATLRFDFSAQLGTVNADLLSTFTPGQNVSGYFIVDDTATNSAAGLGVTSRYIVTQFSATFPNYSAFYSGVSNILSITNNGDYGNPAVDMYDNYTVLAGSWTAAAPVNGFAPDAFVFVYERRGLPPINNLLNTLIPLDPDLVLPFAFGNFQFAGFRNVQLRNVNISASPVPLPAALPLLAAGLGAMGFMGWRKKRKFNSAT